MLAPELKHQVWKLWDKFWAGGIANPLPAIEQITYLIFMKRLEVLDKQRQEEGKPSIFDGPDDLRRWSKFKYLSAEDTGSKGLLPHVRDTVFPFIQGLDVLGDAFVHEMRDAVFMIPKPSLLSEAIVILDSLFDQQRHVLAGRNADILGDIYEHLLSEIRTAGKNGQFRTPRHIIRAIIELIDPKPGERICDPAFGTGGFLVNSYQHMLKMHTARDSLVFDADGTPHNLDGDLLGDRKRFLTGCNFVGYDFDRTMVRLGLMNMVLHGIDDPHGRSLTPYPKGSLKPSNMTWL
jgi:type I restriction enzyme M protein